MKKILAFCLLCNFVFGGVANTKNIWTNADINGENIVCDGEIYNSSGAGATYAFDNTMIICPLENDKNSAKFVISSDDNKAVFGENCKLKQNEGWFCETKKDINMENVKLNGGSDNIEFFDETEIFESGRFWLK